MSGAGGARRIGVLECDHVEDRHRPIAGGTVDMLRSLLSPHAPDIELVPYDVIGGVLPSGPTDCDGWICPGSRHSVYDELPWMDGLSAFVRDVRDASVPFVGICFGHQLLAQALGGRVEKAGAGWGMGVHAYDLDVGGAAWAGATPPPGLRLQAMHQDQVVTLPEGARVWARSAHCPIAGFTVGDRVWTVQAHPEFPADYSRGLIERRRAIVDPALADVAAATVDDPTDHELVAGWIAHVLRSDAVARA